MLSWLRAAGAGSIEKRMTSLAIALALVVAAPDAEERRPERASVWVPALEITGYNVLQNRYAYHFNNPAVYDVSLETWKHNLTHWWWDEDNFGTNGFAHPYMGSLYFNAARSTGFSFWQSAGFSFAGSLQWEVLGETEPPSVNDQITTPWAGTIVGEILHRLSNRVLDGGGARPGFWRELGALVLDPFQGFNRILYGNKYRPPAALSQQSFYSEFWAGVSVASDAQEGGEGRDLGPVTVAVHAVNGIPGSDWRFERPFDHFDALFGITVNGDALQEKGFMTILLRGAIAVAHYGERTSSGIWGLYFNYDYIAPAVFRAQSSNVGLGITGQVDWGDWAFQGHALLGVGFGAGGASSDEEGARDYHFGAQAAVQLEGALFYGDALRVSVRGRELLTGSKVTDEQQAWEDLTYAVASVAWRFSGRHAIGVEGVGAWRRAHYPDEPDVFARVLGLQTFYQFGSDLGLGRGR
jgi:hypothetical protein